MLRRGPSDWVRLSLWRTDTDTFEHGQWLRARVYERRCDVSPDGSLFVYFARGHSGPRPSTDGRSEDSWMAICRPPWLTALALWWVGGTYWLGGCFPPAGPTGERTVFVGGTVEPPDQGALPEWLTPTRELPYFDRTNEATERTVYFNRLLREGWVPVDGARMDEWERRSPVDADLTLTMTHALDLRAYGGMHVQEYGVSSQSRGDVAPLGRLTWADWDHRGRLVLAKDGRLSAWRPDPWPAGSLDSLADFNPQTPDPQPSPEIARRWPATW